jgi:hypothetical protein
MKISKGKWFWFSVDDSGVSMDVLSLRVDMTLTNGRGSRGRRRRVEITARKGGVVVGFLLVLRGKAKGLTIICEAGKDAIASGA